MRYKPVNVCWNTHIFEDKIHSNHIVMNIQTILITIDSIIHMQYEFILLCSRLTVFLDFNAC